MAYDKQLEQRIDAVAREWGGFTSKQMFGGVGWLRGGRMCVGIWQDSLIVRCSLEDWPRLLEEPHVRQFDVTGRSMRGWLLVSPTGLATAAALRRWLLLARDFIEAKPAKAAAGRRAGAAGTRPGKPRARR